MAKTEINVFIEKKISRQYMPWYFTLNIDSQYKGFYIRFKAMAALCFHKPLPDALISLCLSVKPFMCL